MDNFTQHKKDDDTWYSTPFYSGPQGYKMRLAVYAGFQMSVYVQIIRGEYDDTITWPYTGTVTYEIINWKDDRYNVKNIIDFSKEGRTAGNKPRGEDSNDGYGHINALYYNDIHYIYNDILYIKVSCK